MRKPSVVTVDLDSTLCNTSPRHHLLPPPEVSRATYDWRIYSMGCADDLPVSGVVQLCKLLSQEYALIAVTGRAEEARDLTVSWLKRHVPVDFFDIRMAENQGRWSMDGTTHGQYKARKIKELQDEGHDVVLHLDDWADVEPALAELNVPTLLVRPPWLVDTETK